MRPPDDGWHTQETYKSLMTYGQGLLRFCFLANGASVVALLTFVGNLSANSGHAPSMKLPMALFVCGVVAAGVAALFAYCVQYTLYNEARSGNQLSRWRSHSWWLRLTLGSITISMSAFAGGSLIAVARLA